MLLNASGSLLPSICSTNVALSVAVRLLVRLNSAEQTAFELDSFT